MSHLDLMDRTRRRRRSSTSGAAILTATVLALGLMAAGAQAAVPAPADDTLAAQPTGALDVLANDSDPDGPGDTLTVAVAAGPANGTATCASTGACFYRAAAGYTGADAFTYTATDPGGQSATATVDVLASAPNATQPIAATDDDVATIAPHPVTVDVLDNDHGSALVVQSSTRGREP